MNSKTPINHLLFIKNAFAYKTRHTQKHNPSKEIQELFDVRSQLNKLYLDYLNNIY